MANENVFSCIMWFLPFNKHVQSKVTPETNLCEEQLPAYASSNE